MEGELPTPRAALQNGEHVADVVHVVQAVDLNGRIEMLSSATEISRTANERKADSERTYSIGQLEAS